MKLVKGDEKEMFSAHDIALIFEGLGLNFNYDVLISDLDGIDRSLKEEIIQKMKEICRHENGRYFLFHPCGIFWIRKGPV